MKSLKLMALDVGTKRVGVALADSSIKIAIPFITIEIDNDLESSITKIIEIISKEEIDILVVGLPRNQRPHKPFILKNLLKILNIQLIELIFKTKA